MVSSASQKVTNAVSAHAASVEGQAADPLIAFAQWLTHLSARGTYWLLLLLLLMLIAFEIARRRARRKETKSDND
jgi:hypothetical protein